MFSKFNLILLIAYAAYTIVEGQSANPLVRTAHGLLSGAWKVSKNGRTFASFQGIPYARPPVGKYRFREPQKLKPWIGTWDGTRPGAMCLQYDPLLDVIQGSEDCLFVNVYTPQHNAPGSLPVFVFIHGGAFMYGSGTLYDPSFLMDRDIVVVTMNYRLGPFGFLSTGDDLVPGNMGLKDQSMALRWVKENIVMFGGDPAAVTLSGCSAGAASVHYHLLSPMSRGLFARAMAMSGAAFAPWTQAVRAAEKARGVAGHVGCPTTTVREMVDCMRYRPAESIVQAQSIYFDWKVHMFTVFVPTVEPSTSRDPFLVQRPYEVARSGSVSPVPLLASVTSAEGLYPAAAYQKDPHLLPELEANWAQLASEIFIYNETLPASKRQAVADKIKTHYLKGKPVGQDTFLQLVEALSDRLFCADVGKAVDLHARAGHPVFVYRYSFRGEYSLSTLMAGNNENYGASHADDLLHIFGFPLIDLRRQDDVQMKDMLLDLVYSFATTGVPTVGGAQWPAVVPGSPDIPLLEISAPGSARHAASADFGQRSFWDSLGFQENANVIAIRVEL